MTDDSRAEELVIISVSALNQYSYCPRRCYLIHAEGEFTENVHTVRGTREHERVDEDRTESSAQARVDYALPVWSQRLGLSGKCDAVEHHQDGTVYPVEHKHGKRRKWLNDDLQLAAQAMCLEEMLEAPVPKGAIYHQQSRRRREVDIDAALREAVESTVVEVRAILASDQPPAPIDDPRKCRECSLREICQPELGRAAMRLREAASTLFKPEDEPV